MYDVGPEHYTTVIREMIRHEDNLTNNRIMWLLIGQGFLANAFVFEGRERASSDLMIPIAGIFVTLSVFERLYKSYQARGYLKFLGERAKQGTLQEEHLPLTGWPRNRIKGWWRDVWVCPWIGQTGEMLEPWLFMPYLFVFMWLTILLRRGTMLDTRIVLILVAILSAAIFSVFCIVLVWSQGKDEERTEGRARASRTDGAPESS
jgi:hypothetical protein